MPSLVLIRTSCDALMHHPFWTMPWDRDASLVLNAVGRDAITRSDERAMMHWCLTMPWWRVIVFHKYICSAYVWKHGFQSWCISQSRSSKMTHAQRSALFWTNVIGRSMAHYRIEQKYLIITNYILGYVVVLTSSSIFVILPIHRSRIGCAIVGQTVMVCSVTRDSWGGGVQ
jgi:hypothetical protein